MGYFRDNDKNAMAEMPAEKARKKRVKRILLSILFIISTGIVAYGFWILVR